MSGWIEACMRLNGIQEANVIEPGQTLKVPPVPPPTWVGDLYTVQEYPGHR